MVDSETRDCVITFGGNELTANLTILDMREFDVIISLYWLTTWNATLDYFANRVCFRLPDHPKFYCQVECNSVVRCNVSAVRVEKIICRGYEAYFVFVLAELQM